VKTCRVLAVESGVAETPELTEEINVYLKAAETRSYHEGGNW